MLDPMLLVERAGDSGDEGKGSEAVDDEQGDMAGGDKNSSSSASSVGVSSAVQIQHEISV